MINVHCLAYRKTIPCFFLNEHSEYGISTLKQILSHKLNSSKMFDAYKIIYFWTYLVYFLPYTQNTFNFWFVVYDYLCKDDWVNIFGLKPLYIFPKDTNFFFFFFYCLTFIWFHKWLGKFPFFLWGIFILVTSSQCNPKQ